MAAKMIAVKDLAPGDILADAVLSVSGKVLLGKEVALTPKHISLLNTWDVQNVFIKTNGEDIQDEAGKGVGGGTAEPSLPKTDSAGYLEFIQEYDSIVTKVSQTFDLIRKRNVVPVQYLKDTAGSIHASIISKGATSAINYLLVGDYKLADFISRHSVMVAYFAGVIARQLKWDEQDVAGVALAGLLHDVGNLLTDKPDDPRTKPHIAEAASLLKSIKGLSPEVVLGIVQHRECIDGSGFPTGVNGLRIAPYAKVIAVADLFHSQAYASEHANPFPVLDVLANEMFGKLDPSVCHTFISGVRDSLLNNKVLLSTGEEAEVIYFYPNGSCLPVVRTADGLIIDLSQRGGSAVSRIVSPS
jgi:putative nucleotidyltransferase with HDIG domain